jgi:octaprenyl-diphosphate synthase
MVNPPASLMTTSHAHAGPAALKSPPFEAIQKDLALVETAVAEQIDAFDPAVEPYISYVCNTSGKRIRPALSILTGRALGGTPADSVQLGVIIELIHMATLVHDDIIDGASTRRMMPTANAKWGNSLAVLLGDALFSHALALATDFNDNAVARKVGLASRQVCQGEIIQTQRRFDLSLGKDDYFRIIEMKTGALFEAATGIAAMIAGVPAEIESRIAAYGMQLGTAYQIYDDCLDIIGTEQAAGKTLRTDLAKGKLTLPILNLLENATDSQRTKLNRRILDQEPLDLPVLVGIAEYEGAIEAALDTGLNLLENARSNLEPLAPSQWADALDGITRYVGVLLENCRR